MSRPSGMLQPLPGGATLRPVEIAGGPEALDDLDDMRSSLVAAAGLDASAQPAQLCEFYDRRGLTGPALEHVSGLALYRTMLDPSGADWPVRSYGNAVSASWRAWELAYDVSRQVGNQAPRRLARARVDGTPIGRLLTISSEVGQYEQDAYALMLGLSSVGAYVSNLTACGRIETRADRIVPISCPELQLAVRGRLIRRRRLPKLNELPDPDSLPVALAQVDGLAAELSAQNDRLLAANLAAALSLAQSTKAGNKIGIRAAIATTLDGLVGRVEHAEENHEGGGLDSCQFSHRALGALVAKAALALERIPPNNANGASEELLKLVENRTIAAEKWISNRDSCLELLRQARQARIERGMGVLLVRRAIEAPPETAGESAEADAADVPVGSDNTVAPAVEPSSLPEPQPAVLLESTESLTDPESAVPEAMAFARQLDWEVLPSGTDLEYIKELVSRDPRFQGPDVVIEWSRIEDLLLLVMEEKGELYRSKPGTLGTQDTYFVAVFKRDGRVAAVAENPVYGNATYLLLEDLALGTWQEVFSLDRRSARSCGAQRMAHTDMNAHIARVQKGLHNLLRLAQVSE